ncbi:hypothetical protein ACQKM1_13110 [Peribacillus frigoritolerans]|uniref:hypothetical protein n=1 Tax=Peribacillus frigoritolerans TaxID=450367 RepID=UPI003CFC0A78
MSKIIKTTFILIMARGGKIDERLSDPCSDADDHSAQTITVVIGANASLLQW